MNMTATTNSIMAVRMLAKKLKSRLSRMVFLSAELNADVSTPLSSPSVLATTSMSVGLFDRGKAASGGEFFVASPFSPFDWLCWGGFDFVVNSMTCPSPLFPSASWAQY